ncbi:NADH:flavin oxidoreductase [Thermodesulfobacteriota bacterium]
MTKLFEPITINGMELRNRFVRSATWEAMAADDGACTPALTGIMSNLAKGGVGLIITGHAYVRREGQAGPWQIGFYDDELIPGLREMTHAVHENGGKIVPQLSHGGIYSWTDLTKKDPLAPSVVNGLSKRPPREMNDKDIREVVEAFGLAAQRARESGFDGVQIQAAHGYLISQFLSPALNTRTDSYGGTLENRARVLMQVLQAIRETVGPDFPVLVKLNCRDFVDHGVDLEESIRIGRMLADGGADAIELSGGLPTAGEKGAIRKGIESEDLEAYFRQEALEFKNRVPVPLILVGGIRSCQVAARLVEEGNADCVSMSRPFIREPGLVNRWRMGDSGKSECLSDNLCYRPAISGKGLYCVHEKRKK